MAVIDVAGFVADLKDQAIERGFHIQDERHFVETYSLRQAWEIDLHPEDGCAGPIELHITVDIDPRVLLQFEDHVSQIEETEDPEDAFHIQLLLTWSLPPLDTPPDLLILATDLASVGGVDMPLQISATDITASVTDATERSFSVSTRRDVSLSELFMGRLDLADFLNRCLEVSRFLLSSAPSWLS